MNTPLLTILQGDALSKLKELPSESVHMCCTSPPYFRLRQYGVEGQIGLEKTPEEYVANLVAVFREVRRVLRKDGTLWVNLGDSYAGSWGNYGEGYRPAASHKLQGIKPKDLIGIPWLVAFALRADGWWLRSEITWCKTVPMPESVLDRPTSATEKIFLLTKSAKYWYDAEAVRNPPSESFLNDSRWKTGLTPENEKNKKGYADAGAQNPKQVHRMFDKQRGWHGGGKQMPGDGQKTFGEGRGNYGLRSQLTDKQRGHSRRHAGFNDRWDQMTKEEQMRFGSNMRNYWVLGPEPFKGDHFATFPTEVPCKCILAGCPIGGTVLDPFAGSGTTGQVALELGRKAVLIELNPAYIELIHQRTNVTPGLPL